MKTKNMNQELQNMTGEQLHEKLNNLRRELFNLNMSVAASHVKDSSLFKKLRTDIARVCTRINQVRNHA